MKPLYLNSAVHSVLPDGLHPGGLTLTKKIADLTEIKGKIIVDAGCGSGTSLDFLLQYQPKQLIGLDIQQELLKNAAQNYPAVQGDLIMAECAWNMSSQRQALAEFHRILRPQGRFALSDIYRRTAPDKEEKQWPIPCCFAAAKTKKELEQMLKTAGFVIDYFADYSKLLKESAARFIFQYGSLQEFWQAVCGERRKKEAKEACTLAKAMLPGLFLLLARKIEK